MPEVYRKQPLTFADQLQQLIDRGLVVHDKAQALATLESISYYRLSAYWYPFRIRDVHGKVTSDFHPGTEFNEAIRLYEFDRELRSLVMDAIERIEVAIRTRITYHMGHKYGAFAHTDPAHFHRNFRHAQWLQKLSDETTRSSDEFIKHFKSKYVGFPTTPVWMATEIMSFGGLSLFYNGMINNQNAGTEDKKAIADHFNIHHKRLGDWLHKLTYIRNICAHHSRLWNRELAIRPEKSKDSNWLPPVTPRNDRIFYIMLMLRFLLKATGNGDDWKDKMNALITPIAQNKFYADAMGLPVDWQQHPLWK